MTTWMLIGPGQAFDLVAPVPAQVGFAGIATALARLPRFGGFTDIAYSVAQHCVLGADWLFDKRCDGLAALAFLLHDAHEAYLGDMVRPAMAALDQVAAERAIADGYAVDPQAVSGAIGTLKRRLDGAIFAAAGLPPALPVPVPAWIETLDARLCETERQQLLGRAPAGRAFWTGRAPEPLPFAIKCWPEEEARQRWLAAYQRYRGMLPSAAPVQVL